MKHVLHIPDDWMSRWGPTIDKIKATKQFQLHHGSYSSRCDTSSFQGEPFYELLVGMLNVILYVTCKSPPESTKPEIPRLNNESSSSSINRILAGLNPYNSWR